MNTVRVKICGLRSEHDLDIAVSAGADAVGLLCSVPVDTPREIDVEHASTLAASTPPFVTSVLVTMPNSVDEALDLLTTIEPDAIQIHGDLSVSSIAEIATEFPVIRALSVTDSEHIHRTASVADAILLDSVDETGAGGTGETHDWDRAADVVESLDIPVILAGGLTPKNVTTAINQVRPYAVDVASGVEDEHGKDPTAVHSFIEAARNSSIEVELP